MSVEQTEQLIQLILNSLLLVTICVIVLSSLLMRHTSIVNRLQTVQQDYFKLLEGAEVFRGDRLKHLKHQIRSLRRHYRLTHISILAAHYALLCCIASTLVVAFRAFIYANWLIQLALVLFVAGVAILMVSIGLALFDLYSTNHSVREEINWVLSLGMADRKAIPVPPQRRSPHRKSAKPLRRAL